MNTFVTPYNQTNRQAGRHTDIQKEGQAYIHTYRQADRQTYRRIHTYIHADRQDRAGQGREEQDRAGQKRTGQDRTGHT